MIVNKEMLLSIWFSKNLIIKEAQDQIGVGESCLSR